MFGIFALSVFGLVAFGTTVDHCKAEGLDVKACIKYVEDNSKPEFKFNG